MRKKRIFLFFIFLICIIILIIAYKLSNLGNNINKSDDYKILNISSYEAEVQVEVHSNKNTNKYLLKQKYVEPNIFRQEIIKPENINGLTTTFDGTNLTLEHSNLNLKTVYENYSSMTRKFIKLE